MKKLIELDKNLEIYSERNERCDFKIIFIK